MSPWPRPSRPSRASGPSPSAMRAIVRRRAGASTSASSPDEPGRIDRARRGVSGRRTMARLILYNLLLFGACGYAFWRGKVDARIIAAAFFVGNFATFALRTHLSGGYSALESGIFAVDVACFLAFTYAALISDRFWPLWVSGLQLTTSFGHVLKAIDSHLLPLAYAAA